VKSDGKVPNQFSDVVLVAAVTLYLVRKYRHAFNERAWLEAAVVPEVTAVFQH
jgi:hypothetical protein